MKIAFQDGSLGSSMSGIYMPDSDYRWFISQVLGTDELNAYLKQISVRA